MTAKSLSLILYLAFAPAAALAISNEANPWLALESAACAAHVMTEYSAEIGASVSLTSAKWHGAGQGLVTHCYVRGMLNGEAIDVRLPTVWNGQIYALCDKHNPSPTAALNAGSAVAFTAVTPETLMLLKAMVQHHYPEAQGGGFTAKSICD